MRSREKVYSGSKKGRLNRHPTYLVYQSTRLAVNGKDRHKKIFCISHNFSPLNLYAIPSWKPPSLMLYYSQKGKSLILIDGEINQTPNLQKERLIKDVRYQEYTEMTLVWRRWKMRQSRVISFLFELWHPWGCFFYGKIFRRIYGINKLAVV